MKKRLKMSLLGLLLVVIGSVVLWPLSFTNVISEDEELYIVIIDSWLDNGNPVQNTTDYRFQPDSEEFIQIRQILSKYSFHRSHRSFFNDALLNGNDAGYWLQLHSGGKYVISGGTGEVTVNNHVYRIGYWNNKTALAMMDEIRSVLDH